MTTVKRYLFAIVDGGGTVPADTSVIRAVVGRGHDVRVLADRVLAPDVEATGAEHVPWTRAPQRPDLDPRSVVIEDWDAKSPFEAFARQGRRARRARRPVRRRRARGAAAPSRGRCRGEPLRLRRTDRRGGGGRAVRLPRVEPAVVPRLGHAAARPGPEGRARTARARPRRGDQSPAGAAVRQGARPAQRGPARQRARADRVRAPELRARRPASADDEPRLRVRELQPTAERASDRPAARRSRLGGPLVAAGGRRPARARRHELHVHGPPRRAPARGGRPRRAARPRSRHDRPRYPRGRDRRASERRRRRARAAQPGAAPCGRGRHPRRSRHGHQGAGRRRAAGGAWTSPRFRAGARRLAAAIAAETADDRAVAELEALAGTSAPGGGAKPLAVATLADC